MTFINDMLAGFKRVDLRAALPDIIVDKGPDAVQLVRNQLNVGTDGTGNKITPKYADAVYGGAYTKMKAQMNPLPGYGTPDGYLTGALYQGLKITADPNAYTTTSDVDYIDDPSLTQYGEQLLSMNDENKGIFAQESLKPAIIEYIEVTVNG